MRAVFTPFVSVFRRTVCLGATVLISVPALHAADEVDFRTQVKPVLESACIGCHGPKKDKGGLRLDTKEWAFKGGDSGDVIVPGDSAKSPLFSLTILPEDHDDIMPPSEPLDPVQTDVLKRWIDEGAKWPEGETLTQVKRISFVEDVQPILEFNCVACHRDDYDKGGVSYTSEKMALTSGDSGASLKPWKSGKSRLYKLTTLSLDDDELMPPAAKGGPLDKELTEILKAWIDQGAVWPDNLLLEPKKKAAGDTGDNLQLVQIFHPVIVDNSKVSDVSKMEAYKNRIPGSLEDYEMVPIPGGQYIMGSPEDEKGHKEDEGPQHEVKIEPFWMGKFEVTWNEFELFMYRDEERKYKDFIATDPAVDVVSDAVARPTQPYVEMSFGMGKDGFPAISMTQHAARKY